MKLDMTEEERAENARTEMKKTGKKLPKNTQLSSKDNVKYTLHSLDLMTLPPIDVRVCQEEVVRERCVDYFEMCMRDEMKPSFAGFALALGVGRVTLMDYLQKKTHIPLENHAVLMQFNGVLNALAEDYMQNGKVNPVSAIFLMKNNFGYKDAQEFVVNNSMQEETTPEGLMEEANLLLETEPKKANIDS